MFSLFNGVFKLNPDKIVSQLKRSLLGDYSEDIGEFVQDVRTDVVSTVTDWGKTWGLSKTRRATTTSWRNRRSRMQPIVDK